jgi:hypothetical protein
MDVSSIDKKFLARQERLLTSHLNNILPIVKENVESITKEDFSLLSFHAQIGSRNSLYIDGVRTKFIDSEDFIAQWLCGLVRNVERQIDEGTFGRGRHKGADYYLIQYLKDLSIREYVFTFLTRNFYRNFKERVRNKPDENLWSLWFGNGNLVWGLVIEPVLRDGCWTNDKSEMRRASYNYWTIGHIVSTGLIDPTSNSPIRFGSPEDFLGFYKSVIIRTSNSQYEKEIADRYIEYLKRSDDLNQELFLIPEFRYAGKEVKHIYRLDYTILNSYVMKMTGFEISPASTHISLERTKDKTQKSLNFELSQQWSKEMTKRNSYFSKYGISTVTFTDTDLGDVKQCFQSIEVFLRERADASTTLHNAISEMELFIDRYKL